MTSENNSESVDIKKNDDSMETLHFAESMLELIGREAGAPEQETIKDLLQIAKDRQIIHSAFEGGYVADAPITIRHFAKFKNEDLAKYYIVKAIEGGLELHSIGHIASTGQYQARLTQDTKWTQLEISKVTILLRRLAADFQGEYQGWTLND